MAGTYLTLGMVKGSVGGDWIENMSGEEPGDSKKAVN